MHLGDKTSESEIRPPVPIPFCKGFALTNFIGAGPYPYFFLSNVIHQSVDGKHLFTTLFKLYDAPDKVVFSQGFGECFTTNTAPLD